MAQPQQQQFIDAVLQLGLIESKELSVGLAEIIGHLQRKEHLAALGTLRGLEEKFRFLGTVLEAGARRP
jgi:hypothetical protein